MSEPRTDQAPPRPRQVTLAAVLIMAGSAFIVLSVFEQISGIRSIEARESAQEFLATPPRSGLGLDVEGVLRILRTLAMVAGGCATAAAILGGYVLQRSRSARLGLSVLALPLFVSGLATGGFMSSVVAASAVMLWFQPARDWFDGITRAAPEPTRQPLTRESPAQQSPRRPGPPMGPTSEAGPPAYSGFGTPSAGSTALAPGSWPAPDAAQRVSAGLGAPAVATRPVALVWACALTWALCGLAIVGMLLSVLVIATSPDLVFDELNRQNPDLVDGGLTTETMSNATYATAAVAMLWSVVAIVFAVLAWRRTAWARVALLASACVAAVVFLLATLGNVVLAAGFLAAGATAYLLTRPEVRGWFTSAR